jgi:glycosyltransferase involved in cell wall biosynthesis
MISVVILTKNEEKNIVDCLESIVWADEVVIIDDYSSDRTLDVIQKLNYKNLRVFKRSLNKDFASQRNFALEKVKFDWVLFVDADELISGELREEINYYLIDDKNKDKYDGFYIPRRDIMWGKMLKHGEAGNIKLLRLARKSSGKWIGKIHEEWSVKENVSELDNYIVHHPHPTISEFLKEINFYTTIRAQDLFDNGTKTNILEVIFYPKAKFILNYLFKLGFLDGIEGFIFAILMSFHSFLVRAKLWIYLKNQ